MIDILIYLSTPRGKVTRSEFWKVMIINFIITGIILVTGVYKGIITLEMFDEDDYDFSMVVSTLIIAVIYWNRLVFMMRRLRDAYLPWVLAFLQFTRIGTVIVLLLCCSKTRTKRR